MRLWVISFLGVLGPGSADANDLADALSHVRAVMGDKGVEGFEEEVEDFDPEEALPLLLARDVTPGNSLDSYRRTSVAPQAPPHFASLGSERLSYPKLKDVIAVAAERSRLPVALLDAMIRTESGYRPRAVSRAGARGLMQLTAVTAESLGVQDAFDPAQNVIAGARYLRRLYDRFGSLPLALAAYNAGPGAVQKHGGIPPFEETKRYIRTVLERAQNFDP